MKKTLKLALFLGVVAAISGLLLGLVNDITAPVIAENALKAEKANLEIMYPGSEFEPIDYVDNDGVVSGIYSVDGKNYIFKASATGYNSSTPIIVLVGLNKDGKIDKVVALQQQETNGFGSRCFETENIKSLYIGKTNANEVDMLAGATFTSTAMKTIMANVFEAYEAIK